MIPVVGTLIVNEIKWLKRQINSVDFPIKNYIIINNSAGILNDELDELVSKPHKFIQKLKISYQLY